MDTPVIFAVAYLVAGLVVVFVVSRGHVLGLEWPGLLVALAAWPVILAVVLVEQYFASSGPANELGRHRPVTAGVTVGQAGVAVSDLRLAGKVTVAGVDCDARADRFVASGTPVVVVGVDGFGLLVRPAVPDAEPGDAPDPAAR